MGYFFQDKPLEEIKGYTKSILDEIEKAFMLENPDDACSIGNLSMNVTVSNIKKENLGNVMTNYNIGF